MRKLIILAVGIVLVSMAQPVFAQEASSVAGKVYSADFSTGFHDCVRFTATTMETA